MNLRCDCISCKYETQKSTEDPCYRCYNDSEYVYDGTDYNGYGEWLSLQLQKHEPEPFCPFGPIECNMAYNLQHCWHCYEARAAYHKQQKEDTNAGKDNV